MLTRISKQSITVLLVLSFIIPSSVLFYPKKADAQVTCLAQIAAALYISKKVDGSTRVPNNNDSTSKSSVAGSFVRDCIFIPLVTSMAKALLNNMTNDTIKWINSGFKGNPGFAVDLGGLMQDTADQVIGDFIAKEASFLCSPFSFQVKIALAQSQLPFTRKSRCTLTQVINNVNGFIDNNNRVGWDNWIQVTTRPQNNAYGAYQIYQDELSKKIIDVQAVEQKYLDWGRGFKDWEFCQKDSNGKETCRKETPGAVIEQRLSATLNMDLQQIGFANDFNAIIDALANQLTKQIVTGAAGILGGSRGPRKNSIPNINYADAAKPTTLSTSPLDSAIQTGLTTATNEATQQFQPVDIPPIVIPQTGVTGVITIGPPTPPQTLDLIISPAATTFVNDSIPLSFEASLNTNYLTGGLNFRTAFKPKATMVDTPYLNVFSSINVDYTLYNGTTLNTTITDQGQATIGWSDVGTDTNKPFIVKISGPKRSGATPGVYVLETVIYDNNGLVLDIEQHDITIQ